jgi:type IV pilus assembly protein PilW
MKKSTFHLSNCHIARAQARRQSGLSLVEILVAVTLSLILAAGVGQIYVANKQTYRLQDAQGRMQENARYAFEVISRDLRQAGYRGCAPRSVAAAVVAKAPPGDDINSTPAFVYKMTNATSIVGYDSTPSNSNPTWSTNNGATPVNAVLGTNNLPSKLTNVIRGTDVVSVQYGEACGGNLASAMACTGTGCPQTAPIVLVSTNNCNVSCPSSGCSTNQQVYLISNCTNADIFRASSVSSSTGEIAHGTLTNTNAALSTAYETSSELMIFRSYSYYLRNGEGGYPSLWRMDDTRPTGGNNPLELVEGVDDFQVLYGVDTDTPADGSANRYFVASAVTDWSRVSSVRLTLRLSSVGEQDDNLTGNTNAALSIDGAAVSDRRYRQEFSTTVDLRNDL